MQRAAPQTKAGCNFRHQQKKHQKREGTTPNYKLTTPPKSTRPDQFQKQKKRIKECQLTGTFTTLAKQEKAKANKTTTHSIQNSKESETKEMPTSNGRPRKTLAPFKKITQDCNRKILQERQCIEADQKITESIRLDRDAKFSRMGTWRITKKNSRNGAVHLQTEATDKLAYLLSKIEDPAKRVAFF